jgi:hypothetical protein
VRFEFLSGECDEGCLRGTCCLFIVTAMRISDLTYWGHFGKYVPSTAGLTDYRMIIISMLDVVPPLHTFCACFKSIPGGSLKVCDSG